MVHKESSVRSNQYVRCGEEKATASILYNEILMGQHQGAKIENCTYVVPLIENFCRYPKIAFFQRNIRT